MLFIISSSNFTTNSFLSLLYRFLAKLNKFLAYKFDEEVGSLFSMGDLESMAHVILDELQDKELLLSKGKLGRSRVLENFTYEKNAERFSEIYKRIS